MSIAICHSGASLGAASERKGYFRPLQMLGGEATGNAVPDRLVFDLLARRAAWEGLGAFVGASGLWMVRQLALTLALGIIWGHSAMRRRWLLLDIGFCGKFKWGTGW
jgi:hypothetical protein